jgi:4-hydroxyphenylpyruvate dioxygenase (EC 1.13.11.27)
MNTLSASNPMGTDGFEFVEYAAPEPEKLGALFAQLGFRAVARHRHKNVTLWRQGGINFIVNAEPDSFAQRFARLHGPASAPLPSACTTPTPPTSARWNWAPGASTAAAARWS